MLDKFNRPLQDLRISITDRCNFRCGYCMPAHVRYRFLPRKELLTFEELTLVARIFVKLGVGKLRLTGGEPLLRKDVTSLVGQLAALNPDLDLAMTTNGTGLAKLAPALRAAGLKRVTVSLDTLDPEKFAAMSGRNAEVHQVLAGIDAAQEAGLQVKVNTVVQRGQNDADLIDLATYFRDRGMVLRFIEYMDVGNLNEWSRTAVFSAKDILDRMASHFAFDPLPANYPGEVARRYAYRDGGEFGVIASVTAPFCGACSRARISAAGMLFTCLFSNRGHDLKALLRGHDGEAAVEGTIRKIWENREDRYSEIRHKAGSEEKKKVEMYHIGG